MCSILTLSLINGIKKKHKLDLLFCLAQISLLLYNLELYGFEPKKLKKVPIIPELEVKSLITISLLWLDPHIRATDSFCAVFINSLISRFTNSLYLFNVNHIWRHTCAVVKIEKKQVFFLVFTNWIYSSLQSLLLK